MRLAALDMRRAQHDRRLAVAVEIDPAGEAGVKAVTALLYAFQPVARRDFGKAKHGGRRMQPVDRIQQSEARPQSPRDRRP